MFFRRSGGLVAGLPGVGKTAVVEGLAQKIVDGDVPHKLQGKEVIRLDVVSLVQGTGIRGQFEERMQKLMDEIEKRLYESKETAYKIVNNNFFKSSSYYTDYINMRINQFHIIKRMRVHFERFNNNLLNK